MKGILIKSYVLQDSQIILKGEHSLMESSQQRKTALLKSQRLLDNKPQPIISTRPFSSFQEVRISISIQSL